MQTERDFVLITNVNDKFLKELELKTGYSKDSESNLRVQYMTQKC